MTDYNELTQQLADDCIRHLGGVRANYHHTSDIPTSVIIDRGAQVSTDGGISYSNHTVLTLLKNDVGRVKIGAKVTTSTDVFIIAGIVSEDDEIVEAYTE